MDTFDRILRKIIIYGNGLGGAFLVAMMLVVVATVATRLMRLTFAGSYEMVEVFCGCYCCICHAVYSPAEGTCCNRLHNIPIESKKRN